MLLVSRENSTSNPSAIAMLCTMHHVKNNCEIRRTCSMRDSDQGKGTDASYDAPYWLKLHITSMKTAYKIERYCNNNMFHSPQLPCMQLHALGSLLWTPSHAAFCSLWIEAFRCGSEFWDLAAVFTISTEFLFLIGWKRPFKSSYELGYR